MAIAILKLVGITTLAILGASWAPQPGAAISLESHNFARHDHAARHGLLALRQTAATTTDRKRCKARPSSSLSVSATKSVSTSAPTSTRVSSSIKPTTTVQAPATKPATTTKAAVTTAPATNTGGGKGKVGITYAGDINIAKFVSGSPNVNLLLNWSPYKPPAIPSGIVYGPMLWGAKQISEFTKDVKAGYSSIAFGMNEPNQSGQAELSPGAAASLWQQYMEPLVSQGYTLVSPAPSNAADGVPWLQQFISACTGCHVSGVAAHFYGTDPAAFITYITNYHNTFQRPVYVTEFACQNFGSGSQCSASDVANFMKTTVQFMNSQSWVASYCWFGVLTDMGNVNPANQLINSDSSPNALGRKYLGLDSF